ncbi:hypothetical protein VPH35_052836 [Triticum aestivum]
MAPICRMVCYNYTPGEYLFRIFSLVIFSLMTMTMPCWGFGIPSLLFGLPLPNPDLIQRLGTPNYMPQNIGDQTSEAQLVTRLTRWGFACSILEMFSGVQTWCAKSPDEIYQSVVLKKEKPMFLYNLPTEVANVLSGCYEYDFQDHSLMLDILQSFERWIEEVRDV